ncbi:hypothetical protein BDY24DRAFT_441510, partial [Mrakia frigida]|uniref:uncharacterized protein n=1 Tax=Mrakia frigida TaxID=29902 RepID=UPI003FCC0809
MPEARRSPRPLPWDVLLLVLEECDPSTLAKLGQASFDFLVATSPHLYEKMEVRSVEALEALFCRKMKKASKKLKTPPRINPFLSLSQTRTLLLGLDDLGASSLVSLDFSRISGMDPLPIDVLSLSWRYTNPYNLQMIHSFPNCRKLTSTRLLLFFLLSFLSVPEPKPLPFTAAQTHTQYLIHPAPSRSSPSLGDERWFDGTEGPRRVLVSLLCLFSRCLIPFDVTTLFHA